ncbi:MAG: glycosyltransferase, partial [bacterium]
MLNNLKVALIHEFLITWGGSDLVVQKFSEIFPDAPIFTALYDTKTMQKHFTDRRIVTSFLQRIPFAVRSHRLMMPFFPIAFESFDLNEYDLVLSSHHMAAKGVITLPSTCHICFCHTPMRYAWDFYHKFLTENPPALRFPLRLLFHYLRAWDTATASRVDYFIANSKNIANRIWKYYRRESDIIHSPVETARFRISETKDDFYLVVSRLVSYKRIDLAVEAFNRLGRRLVVVGSGPELKKLKKMARKNVEFTG